jgi:hypothetical protein
MNRLPHLTLTLLVTMLVTACSGGSDSASNSYEEAARTAVQSAVLTLDDLPKGWAVSSLGDESYANIRLSGDCAPLNERGAGFPGEVASEDSEPFAGPTGQELVNTVTAFSDEQAAAAAVDSADSLVVQCMDQLQEALRQAVEVAADDRNVGGLIGDINTSIERDESFPALGDESLAYSLNADFAAFFQRFEVNGHIIAVREGPLAGILVYAALGDQNSDEEAAIAGGLAEHLAQAEATLSD